MPGRLSIAMIVKNESQHLRECLESVESLADECCVTDTGSTDDTIDIARKFGCKVSQFAWCDDFAMARNVSLLSCTCDWVFVIDADERIAAENHAALRALLEGPRDTAYRLTTRNYTDNAGQSGFQPCAANDPHAGGFAGWFPSTKVRLFPNIGAQFEGAVHEMINPSLERAGVHLALCDVPVHHYGLRKPAESLAEKQALYLRLGLAKVTADPENAKAHAELGNQYVDMGDYAKAVSAYRDALRLAPQSPELLKDLGGVLHLTGRQAEAEKALRLAVTMDPGHVEAWRNLGVVLAAKESWEEARECFARALALAPASAELAQYVGIVEGMMRQMGRAS